MGEPAPEDRAYYTALRERLDVVLHAEFYRVIRQMPDVHDRLGALIHAADLERDAG